MKPHRISVTNILVDAYGLTEHMGLYEAKKASSEDIKAYHSPQFVEYIKNTDPKYFMDDIEKAKSLCKTSTADNLFNIGDDWYLLLFDMNDWRLLFIAEYKNYGIN